MRYSIPKKQIKLGVFSLYVPHYRIGIFEELSRDKSIELTVSACGDWPDSSLKIRHDGVGFRFLDVRTYRIGMPFLKTMLNLQPTAVWSMLRGKYDVFVMSNRLTCLCVWCNLILGRLLGRRVCLWGHGFRARDGFLVKRFRKFMMRLAYANILYTEGGRDKAIEMGLAAEKLFVAYNSLDTNASATIRKSITAEKLDEFKAERNIQGKKLIVYSGRLLEYKRPDMLVRAMKYVVEQVPQAHAVIIGDGPVRAELEALIDELGLEDSVTLTGAIYDEQVMACYMMSSDAAVMPAHTGLCIQHAFDYGVPIVVGDNMAEHPPEIELVTDGVNGFYCRDGEPQDFAEAICRLLMDEQLRRRMSANARKLIETKFNVGNMTEGIIGVVKYSKENRRQMSKEKLGLGAEHLLS